MTTRFSQPADESALNTTVEALKMHGFAVQVYNTAAEAKKGVLSLIPKGKEVFTNTSVTLDTTGIAAAINESGDYISGRDNMMALMSDPEKKKEMKKISATPDYSLGSVHAITQDGKLLIASFSGRQLPPAAYGADNVIFVAGSQKLVEDLAEGIQRIEEYTVPLEDKRAMKAYGMSTAFNKLLVINGEFPGRITVVIVKENIGF